MHLLFQTYGIVIRGALDLQHIWRAKYQSFSDPSIGLYKMASMLLPDWKEGAVKDVSHGDWARMKLSDRQIEYAAYDAWLSLQLGIVLLSRPPKDTSNKTEKGPVVIINKKDVEKVLQSLRRLDMDKMPTIKALPNYVTSAILHHDPRDLDQLTYANAIIQFLEETNHIYRVHSGGKNKFAPSLE